MGRFRAGRWMIAAVLLATAGGSGIMLTQGWFRAGTGKFAADPLEVALIVSGDTAGWITPCGCTSNQSGGLLRRGTVVAAARKKGDVILLDAGGAPGGTSPYDREKFAAILRGEREMGVAAHNLGGPEAALGADALQKLVEELQVPFVSCNLFREDGTPVTQALRIVRGGGKTLAVVGVLSPRYKRSGLQIRDPRDAILEAVRNATEKFDRLIVLAYLPEAELRQLAAALPEADIVIGGPTGQSLPPTPVGERLLASATNKGKFLVWLSPGKNPTGNEVWAGKIIELNTDFADDPGQKQNVDRFYARLTDRDYLPSETSFAPSLPADLPSGYRIAGFATCAACHKEETAAWEKSAHAHAWTTLVTKKSHIDAECQRCHTTGYGVPGGFQSVRRTPHPTGVSCESCHGPSAAHVADPSQRTPFPAREQCGRCHDHENSPRFDYDGYWSKIAHGKQTGGKKSLPDKPRENKS